MARFSAMLACLLLACSPGFLWPPSAGAQTAYQWTDDQGGVHFTDDLSAVPDSVRGELKTLSMPAPAPTPGSGPSPAGASPAPAVEGSAAVDSEGSLRVDEYQACVDAVAKRRGDLEKALAKDQGYLKELNRSIHRTTTSRQKNELQRTRVEVQKRIGQNQEAVEKGLPAMLRECDRKKPYVP